MECQDRVTSRRNQNVAVLLGLLVLASSVVYINKAVTSVHTWQATHWLFAFHDGYFSRALVGSFIKTFLPQHYGSYAFISVSAWMVQLLVATLLAILAYRYWLIKRDVESLLVGGLLLLSSGTLRYFGMAAGVLDQIGYLLVLLVLIGIWGLRPKWQWVTVLFASLILVLIHEAFILLIAPVMAASVLVVQSINMNCKDSNKLVAVSVCVLVPGAVLASLMLTAGRSDFSEFPAALRHLQEQSDFPVSLYALMVQFRDVSANIGWTTFRLLETGRIPSVFIAIMVLLPSLIVGLAVVINGFRLIDRSYGSGSSKLSRFVCLACCLMPLLLLVIGHDYPRWMASSILNLFIVGMTVAIQSAARDHNPKSSGIDFPLTRWFVGAAIGLSLLTGPVCNMFAPTRMNVVVWLFRRLLSWLAELS